MGLSRSTSYDPVPVAAATGEVLVRIKAICDEFECYGYRRVGAALRHQGVVVNNKKLSAALRPPGPSMATPKTEGQRGHQMRGINIVLPRRNSSLAVAIRLNVPSSKPQAGLSYQVGP